MFYNNINQLLLSKTNLAAGQKTTDYIKVKCCGGLTLTNNCTGGDVDFKCRILAVAF